MKIINVISRFFKKIISGFRKHFEKRGVVNGTKDIIDAAVAVGIATVAVKVVIDRIRVRHMFKKSTTNNTVIDAPIDIVRGKSSVDMYRKAKSDKKSLDKSMKEIRKEAVDQISQSRNELFNSLSYKERKQILEDEGADLESVEQQILAARKIKAQIEEDAKNKKRSDESLFMRFRSWFPNKRARRVGYVARMEDRSSLTNYEVIAATQKKAAKSADLEINNPNRFLFDRANQALTPDTYENKERREKKAATLINRADSIDCPSRLYVLPDYGEKVHDAFMDMTGQLSRMCSVRRCPSDQRVYGITPSSEMADNLVNAVWGDPNNTREAPEPVEYGEVKNKFYGRTNQDPNEPFFDEAEEFERFCNANGISLNKIMTTEELEKMENLLHNLNREDETDGMNEVIWNERFHRDTLSRTGGVNPKDIPFFDNNLYDTDLDPLLAVPQRLVPMIRHKPITAEDLNFDLDGNNPSGKTPKHMTVNPKDQKDYRHGDYLQELSKLRAARAKTDATRMQNEFFDKQYDWAKTHPGTSNDLLKYIDMEEIENNEIRKLPQGIRDKSYSDILDGRAVADMTRKERKRQSKVDDFDIKFDFGSDDDEKSKKKKKKKHKDEDVFGYDFFDDDKKKDKKKKGKKDKDKKDKKSKKKKKKNHGDKDYDGNSSITSAVLGKMSNPNLRKDFTKQMKYLKTGDFYCKD